MQVIETKDSGGSRQAILLTGCSPMQVIETTSFHGYCIPLIQLTGCSPMQVIETGILQPSKTKTRVDWVFTDAGD